jgi:hypothetical protein
MRAASSVTDDWFFSFLSPCPHRLWGPHSLLFSVYRRLSTGVKQPGREADHLATSNTETKNACSCTSTPQYVFLAWFLSNGNVLRAWCSVKVRNSFTFYLPISAGIYCPHWFMKSSLVIIGKCWVTPEGHDINMHLYTRVYPNVSGLTP